MRTFLSFLFIFLLSLSRVFAQEGISNEIPSNSFDPFRAVEQEILSPYESSRKKDKVEIKRIEHPIAELSGLDKITGHITHFDVYIGETFQFGNLQITPRVCYSGIYSEKPKTDVFIEIDRVTFNKKIQRVFTGWMFAENLGVSALDDPVYDVWLKGCKNKTSFPEPFVPDFPPSVSRKDLLIE